MSGHDICSRILINCSDHEHSLRQLGSLRAFLSVVSSVMCKSHKTLKKLCFESGIFRHGISVLSSRYTILFIQLISKDSSSSILDSQVFEYPQIQLKGLIYKNLQNAAEGGMAPTRMIPTAVICLYSPES